MRAVFSSSSPFAPSPGVAYPAHFAFPLPHFAFGRPWPALEEATQEKSYIYTMLVTMFRKCISTCTKATKVAKMSLEYDEHTSTFTSSVGTCVHLNCQVKMPVLANKSRRRHSIYPCEM